MRRDWHTAVGGLFMRRCELLAREASAHACSLGVNFSKFTAPVLSESMDLLAHSEPSSSEVSPLLVERDVYGAKARRYVFSDVGT